MRLAFFAFALVGMALSMSPKANAQALVDKPFGKYFLFGGMNVRIDAIQTNPKKDGNPVLKGADTIDADKGLHRHQDDHAKP